MCWHHFTRRAMGCEFELWLYGRSEAESASLAEQVWEEVHRLERQLSLYQPDSDLVYLNEKAWQEPVRAEPELFQLLLRCKQLYEETEGAFDPTVTPLLRLWGFVDRRYRVPAHAEIEQTLRRVGMKWVLLEPEGRWVYYGKPGIELSLGAIGKGYALAQAVQRLKPYRVEAALLSAGSSTLYALGAPPGSEGWQVAIRNPSLSEPPLATLLLRDQAFSTSGGTEQGFEVEGKRYTHLLDPRTGYPAKGMASVSVAAQDPTLADALSTALFVAGMEFTERYRQAHPELGIWVFPSES